VFAFSPKSVVGSPATVLVGVPGARTAILPGRVVGADEVRGSCLSDPQHHQCVKARRRGPHVKIDAEFDLDGPRVREPPSLGQFAGGEGRTILEESDVQVFPDLHEIGGQRRREFARAVRVNQPDLEALGQACRPVDGKGYVRGFVGPINLQPPGPSGTT
jgi:hypothetical protein